MGGGEGGGRQKCSLKPQRGRVEVNLVLNKKGKSGSKLLPSDEDSFSQMYSYFLTRANCSELGRGTMREKHVGAETDIYLELMWSCAVI